VKRASLVLALVSGCSANDDVPSPQVAAVTPNHAVPGTTVIVTGSYFCQQPGTTEDPLACEHPGSVMFGTTNGTSTQYTDTSITVEVPGGAGRVDVVVISSGRASNGVQFMFD
jgi:hypothetical protein